MVYKYASETFSTDVVSQGLLSGLESGVRGSGQKSSDFVRRKYITINTNVSEA